MKSTKTSPSYQLGRALALKTAGLIYPSDSERFGNQMKGLAISQLATIAASLGAAGLAFGGVGLERLLTDPVARNKLIKALPKAMDLPADISISPSAPHSMAAHYHPGERQIVVTSRPSPGILAHEMGHASSLAAKNPRWLQAAIMGKRIGFPLVGLSLLAQGFTDPDSAITQVVRYAPAATLTPTILEELRASSRALRGLYRAGGKGAMLKGLLPLVPALGTYVLGAAAPIVGGKIIQHYANR